MRKKVHKISEDLTKFSTSSRCGFCSFSTSVVNAQLHFVGLSWDVECSLTIKVTTKSTFPEWPPQGASALPPVIFLNIFIIILRFFHISNIFEVISHWSSALKTFLSSESLQKANLRVSGIDSRRHKIVIESPLDSWECIFSISQFQELKTTFSPLIVI